MHEQSLNFYLLIIVLISGIVLISRTPLSKTIVILLFMGFLFIAPETASDQDFYAYKTAFENIQLINEYPYVITESNLTSERGFFWYMVPYHLVTSSFNSFLALNFLALIILGSFILKKIGLNKIELRSTMLYALPALIPLVFYWSPRSSPSLILILVSFYFFTERKFLYGLLFSFVAITIHSQYIPFVVVMSATMFLSSTSNKKPFYYASLLSLITLGLLKYGTGLISQLPFGYFGDLFLVAASKLHYIEELGASGGIRLAGIGIIIISSVYFIFFKKNIRKKTLEGEYKILTLLEICIAFSFFVNILFIQDSHVAGRIARFSDFFIIIIGVSFVIKKIANEKITIYVAMISFLSLLLLYRNIYFVSI